MSHHSVVSNLTSNKKNSKQKTSKEEIDIHKNNRLIKFIRQTAEKHKFFFINTLGTNIKNKNKNKKENPDRFIDLS